MQDDKLAYDLMVFSIASSVLNTDYSDKPIAVTLNQVNYSSTIGIDETKAAKSINNVKESLDIAWLSHPTNAEKFSAFQQLSSTHKKRILTYCTALSYHFTVGIDETVLESTNFNLINYWKPTEDTYYKRVTTNRLLEIGKSEIGQEWESKHKSLTKGKLVEQLSQHKKMSGWMPESVL
jgi:ParB family chromosome partitioning protein